jgi:Nif-specific regulatory protein
MVETKKLSSLREIGKDQLELLYNISEMLNVADFQDSLIDRLLDLVIDFLNAERGLFSRFDNRTDEFSIIAARNVARDRIEDLNTFSSGILRKVISEKKACLYHDAQADPDTSQFKSVQLQNIKSVIGVPVLHREDIWGVILVDSRADRQEFTVENLFFLEFFSNLVSLVLDKIIRMEQLQNENILLRNQLEASPDIPEMIGESPAMKRMFNMLQRVSNTDASVLLLGESGTGKELAARAIHNLSQRRDKPFLAQFCGSIPDTLLESELFGYKKGAFSGAYSDKKGLFEVAHQGTFFLDEIGDISLALQAKLLRVLENKEIIRLGDTQVKKVDVRIVAATNQDLPKLVQSGKFREDLYYRLNVFPVVLPPLHERIGDIPLLVEHFLQKRSQQSFLIDREAMKKLENYSWPGNVRQLENVIQRAIILSDQKNIMPAHIILEEDEDITNFKGVLKDYEFLLLKKRLKDFDGNRTKAAKSLGVSVRWVQLKLKEMGEN